LSTFSYIPTYAVQLSVTPRILKTDFGDGYSQRAGDGLNSQPQIWSLEFRGDTTAIDAIETFLTDTGGWESFDWTPPRQTSSKKFIYTSYSRSPLGALIDVLQTTFTQTFDLA
jgi:phage-related protein